MRSLERLRERKMRSPERLCERKCVLLNVYVNVNATSMLRLFAIPLSN